MWGFAGHTLNSFQTFHQKVLDGDCPEKKLPETTCRRFYFLHPQWWPRYSQGESSLLKTLVIYLY